MRLDHRVELIWAWAQEIHKNQKRRYTGKPYSTHLWEVAELSDMYLEGTLHRPIAFLHDAVEDQGISFDAIWRHLLEAKYHGHERRDIVEGVRALTDVYTKSAFPTLNREQRKALESERLGTIQPLYQSIKYADMTTNTDDIAKHDFDFARVYLPEIKSNLDNMRQGDINLFIGACSALVDAQRYIATNDRYQKDISCAF